MKVDLETTEGVLLSLNEYNSLIEDAQKWRDMQVGSGPSIARPYICEDCGGWCLVKRCTKQDSPDGAHWRCHKHEGHAGECDTSMRCAAILDPESSTPWRCGLSPGHDEGIHDRLPPQGATKAQGDGMSTLKETLELIEAEVLKATEKFPTWPTDPLHALAVLGEEYGELTKAVLQVTYEPHKASYRDVAVEALQTAAMAIRFLMSLENYYYETSEEHSQEDV